MSAAVASEYMRCEVEIATALGVRRVEAVRYGAWAVHVADRGGLYALTHLPTGLRVPARYGAFRDEASAIAALREVVVLGHDWGALGLREIRDNPTLTREIVAICLRHGGAGPSEDPGYASPVDTPASLNGYGGRA